MRVRIHNEHGTMLMKNADFDGEVEDCTIGRSPITGDVTEVKVLVRNGRGDLRRYSIFGKNLSVLVMDEVPEKST